jgi:alanine-glyoxylate transaminase/serine-glyoxylate transaminase/serine-pyruvate transaminase
MTALYVPESTNPAAIIGALAKRNIVIAGGLHKDIKTRYIRFGHMGQSVVRAERDDLDVLIKGLQTSWAEVEGTL